MLSLRCNNRDLNHFVPTDSQYADRNVINVYPDNRDQQESAIQNGYLQQKSITMALLPYKIHNINVSFTGVQYQGKDVIENLELEAARTLEEQFEINRTLAVNTETDSSFLITMLYCKEKEKAERIVSKITSEQIGTVTQPVDSTTDALYQKTLTDCVSRYTYRYTNDITPYVKVWKNPYGLIIATNWSDNDQASLHYLTIGLLPVLFPAIKELFKEQELDYFKELVHRSQVKRINNVTVTDLFNKMCRECYEDITLNLLKERLGNEIKEKKIRYYRQELNNAETSATDCLREYSRALNKIEEANKNLMYFEKVSEDIADEITKALKAPYILNLRYEDYQSYLYMTIAGAVKFWESDEAELCINKIEETSVAQRITKQLLTDVFIDRKYKLYVENTFVLGLDSNNVDLDRWIMRNSTPTKYFINPHIYYYGCTGDYKPQLIKAAKELDLMTYLSICYTSLISINFKDGAVWGRLKEALIYLFEDVINNNYTYDEAFKNNKCLEDAEGNRISMREYYEQSLKDAPSIEPIDTLEGDEEEW